jgi:hypothetical protein
MAIDQRRLTANRRNAQKSTGPKSRAGRKRASQNAFRHGLSVSLLLDPDRIANVEKLAREIVDSMAGQIDLGHARRIAHAQLEVLRARTMRTAVAAKIPDGTNDFELTAETLNLTLSALKMFDRYECRAISKRNRAVRLWLEGTSLS